MLPASNATCHHSQQDGRKRPGWTEGQPFINRVELATANAQQVAKIRRIVEDPGNQVASPDEAREILDLKGGDRVAFNNERFVHNGGSAEVGLPQLLRANHIDTPNLDWLASRGVRFEKAYVHSPICGPSRMSFYTGRYVRSHGSTWNGFPFRIGEWTLVDYLRKVGVKCALVGKTHMTPDRDGMKHLGIEPASTIGALVSECGFEVFVRDDGTNHSDYPQGHAEDYDQYLCD